MIDNKQPINTILNERTNERTKVAHCLFEQSGTFKNEFKKLGYEAYDYDILNDYGETDYQIDLFEEIEGGYKRKPSIFDKITKDDIILAFFPCVRFENQVMLMFRGQQKQIKDWAYKEKMIYDMKLLEELKRNYDLVNMLFIICIDRGLKLVMENPYSEEHFLRRYWCYPATIIDKDRRENGDYYTKPTQYWFLNCEPQNNLLWEALPYNSLEVKDAIRFMTKKNYEKTGAKNKRQARSMIHPDYANRFIRQYIIDEKELDIFGKIKETTADSTNEKNGI